MSSKNYKRSNLLNGEETDIIIRKLLPGEKVYCTCVIQLFVAKKGKWRILDAGALCFTKRNKKYFFKLYDTKRGDIMWLHEYSDDLNYMNSYNYFHQFHGEDAVYGFNFASEVEGELLLKAMQTVYNEKASWKPFGSIRNKFHIASESFFGNISDLFGKQQENVIGTPQNFEHLTSIVADPAKSFNFDPELEHILNQAGITQDDLENPELAQAVYEVLYEHDVCEQSDHKERGEDVTPQMFKLKKNASIEQEDVEDDEPTHCEEIIDPPPKMEDGRSALLRDIENFKMRPKNKKPEEELSRKSTFKGTDPIVDALLEKLKKFRQARAMSDDEEDESNDNEWDD